MRKVTMVRLGIAAAISTIGAFGALAAGCTSDDSSTPGNTNDAGQNTSPDGQVIGDDDDSGQQSTDAGDAGKVTPPPPAIDAKLIIVHAAPGLGPVRLCFATSNSGGTATVTAINALPDTKGSAPPYAAPPAYGAYYDGGTSPVVQGTPGSTPERSAPSRTSPASRTSRSRPT